MATVTIATAKEQLNELISMAERGEDIDIVRDGKPVAKLIAARQASAPVDIDWLEQFARSMPATEVGALSKSRNDERY